MKRSRRTSWTSQDTTRRARGVTLPAHGSGAWRQRWPSPAVPAAGTAVRPRLRAIDPEDKLVTYLPARAAPRRSLLQRVRQGCRTLLLKMLRRSQTDERDL